LTVEIETILVNEELAALLEAAEASGQLRQAQSDRTRRCA